MNKNVSGFVILEAIALLAVVTTSIIGSLLCYRCGIKAMTRHNQRNEALQLAYMEIVALSKKSFLPNHNTRQEGPYLIKTGTKKIKREIVYTQIYVEIYRGEEETPIVNLISYE